MQQIIGIDARMYAYTGIGRYIAQLISGLSTLDKKNQYKVFLYPDIAHQLSLPDNFQKIIVHEPIYTFAEQLSLAKRFLREKLDVLHVPHFNAPVWYPKKFLLTIHDITQTIFSSTETFKGKIKKYGYYTATFLNTHRAQKIIAVSEHTKQDLIKTFHVPEKKISVIYEGIPLPATTATVTLSALQHKYHVTQPYALYVGLWGVHKNLTRLIKAFAVVKKKLPNLILVIVGKHDPRYFPDLQKACQETAVEDRIIFTGFVPEEELVAFYRHAQVFVFPSLYEGFGFPPLEACSYGIPVVSSSSSSLPEILGKAAFYCNAKDSTDIAQAIITVITHQNIQKKLQQEGYQQIKKYSWKNMVKATLALYEQIGAPNNHKVKS